jgi:hypothetical protein
MIVLHMKDIQTRYNGLLYNRYFYKLFNYFLNRKARFVELDKFEGLDNVKEDIVIIDPNGHGIKEEMFILIKILNKYKLNNYNFKLYYIAGDIWPVKHSIFIHNIIRTILKSYKYKIIHVSLNIDNLCEMWNDTFTLKHYIDNYIYLQFNYYYKEMDIEFNMNPNSKVLLSGNKDNNIYWERVYLYNLKHPNVVELPFTQVSEYTKQLNLYLCSFVSNVSSWNPDTNIKTVTKFLLLKYLEVLSSGSLLLAEDSIQKEFLELGLIHRNNCYFSSINDITSSIDYITDPRNIEEINRIRLNGYNFYKEYKVKLEKDFDNVFNMLI